MHCITKENLKSKREERSKGMILTYLKPSIEKGKYSGKLCACLKNLDIFRSGKIFYKNAGPQKELIYVLVSLTRGSWRVYKQNYQHKMHIGINKETYLWHSIMFQTKLVLFGHNTCSTFPFSCWTETKCKQQILSSLKENAVHPIVCVKELSVVNGRQLWITHLVTEHPIFPFLSTSTMIRFFDNCSWINITFSVPFAIK